MKIKAKQTQSVEVDISNEQLSEICVEVLCKLIGVSVPSYRQGWYVRGDGDFVTWHEESGGSHSWTEESVLRKATELDKAVYLVLEKMKKL